MHQHSLNQKFNQIKSVDTKLKTCIAESLRKPLMKIGQKLLIGDKATFEQLTTTEQDLWTRFETADIYRFLTREEDTVPEFQYNWTSISRLQPLGPTLATPASPVPAQAPTPPSAPAIQPPAPASPPGTESGGSNSYSSPHSSPTLSTSGTKTMQT